jgi:hypothetical protein
MKVKVVLSAAAAFAAVGTVAAIIAVGDPAGGNRDVAATGMYVRSRGTLLQTLEARLPKERAAVSGLARTVTQVCFGILKHVPSEPTVLTRPGGELSVNNRELMVRDIVRGIEQAMLGESAAVRRKFVATAKSLEWSKEMLTEAVRAFAAVEAGRLGGHSVGLCAEARQWTASDRLSTDEEMSEHAEEYASDRLAKALSALGCSSEYPGQAILETLPSDEGRSARIASERLRKFERRVADEEADVLDEGVKRVERALGLTVLRRRTGRATGGRRTAANATRVCLTMPSKRTTLPSVPLP